MSQGQRSQGQGDMSHGSMSNKICYKYFIIVCCSNAMVPFHYAPYPRVKNSPMNRLGGDVIPGWEENLSELLFAFQSVS